MENREAIDTFDLKDVVIQRSDRNYRLSKLQRRVNPQKRREHADHSW
jgi:hypothetical protein